MKWNKRTILIFSAIGGGIVIFNNINTFIEKVLYPQTDFLRLLGFMVLTLVWTIYIIYNRK